jgi:hypothetical protein
MITPSDNVSMVNEPDIDDVDGVQFPAVAEPGAILVTSSDVPPCSK